MKKSCKFSGCFKPHSSKGWCKRHYADVYHGRMDENGVYRDDYKPVIKNRKCRYPKCNTIGNKKSPLRSGLCNKHRKWAEKGYIDKETCELLPGQKLPNEQGLYTHCTISGCLGKHKAKGLCNKHYRAYKIQKSIYKDGTRAYGVRAKYDYSKRQKCCVRACTRIIDGTSRARRLVKGFCSYHYKLHKEGYYNEWGVNIKELDFLHGDDLKKARKKWLRDAVKKKAIKITWEGETKTIRRWSQITKIKRGTIKTRYDAGLPPDFIFYRGDLRNNKKYKEWKAQINSVES